MGRNINIMFPILPIKRKRKQSKNVTEKRDIKRVRHCKIQDYLTRLCFILANKTFFIPPYRADLVVTAHKLIIYIDRPTKHSLTLTKLANPFL